MSVIKVNEELLSYSQSLSDKASRIASGLRPLDPGLQKNRPAEDTKIAMDQFCLVAEEISRGATQDMKRL